MWNMDDLICNLKNTGECALKLLINAYFIGTKKISNLINCLIFDQKKMIEFNNLFIVPCNLNRFYNLIKEFVYFFFS